MAKQGQSSPKCLWDSLLIQLLLAEANLEMAATSTKESLKFIL